MMPATSRLDTELVRRGLVRSRRRAAELVADGHVRVAGTPARKPSQPVTDHDVLVVAETSQYVSRGAHKLIGALDAVEELAPRTVQVQGSRCLDAGASTGGFTQVLLERGAAHVLALDVGHGQLAEPVRSDPRVTVREGCNVRELTVEDVEAVGERPSLVVADLSFISLTLVLPALLDVVRRPADLLVLVKPQFEVGRERLGSGGVVTSEMLRAEAVTRVAQAALRSGAQVRAVLPSTLPGESGNHEYFLWLGAQDASPGAPDPGAAATRAVVTAVAENRPELVEVTS